MKRFLIGLAYGLAGLLLAIGLTAGAYAIAGRELSKPVRPVRVAPDLIAPSEATSPTPIARQSVDDKGGDRDRSGDSSDSNSGPGSSNSGSGSSNSGSGSDDD